MPGHHGSFQASQFPAFVYMRETIELLCDQATVTLTFLDTTTSVLKLILLPPTFPLPCAFPVYRFCS